MKRAALGFWLILAAVEGRCLAQGTADTAPPLVASEPVCRCAECEPNPLCGTAEPRLWGGVDYLLWWVRRGPTPPLVVTGSPTDPFPGALDQPGTRVLFGDQGIGYGAMNGLRLVLGGWLDRDDTLGAEAGGFVLQQRTARFGAQGDANGQPFLAAPFVNALTGNNNVYFISQNFANPALSAHLTGDVGVFSTTNLWSWEIQGVVNLARTPTFTADALLGFREMSLREDLSYITSVDNLTVGGASVFLTNPVAPGFIVTTFDRFSTANLFNGGQAGLRLSKTWGNFGVEAVGKIALGDMHESVTIAGLTTTNAPLPVTEAVGGIFAQSSNIGHYHRDVFAVIPEAGVNVNVQLTPNVKARVGYTVTYLSSVARPGDQIDPAINIHEVPIDFTYGTPGGPSRPAFQMQGTGFWAQGIHFGIEVTY
jgi:Putative beta barrel porin-7 (BBP7)